MNKKLVVMLCAFNLFNPINELQASTLSTGSLVGVGTVALATAGVGCVYYNALQKERAQREEFAMRWSSEAEHRRVNEENGFLACVQEQAARFGITQTVQVSYLPEMEEGEVGFDTATYKDTRMFRISKGAVDVWNQDRQNPALKAFIAHGMCVLAAGTTEKLQKVAALHDATVRAALLCASGPFFSGAVMAVCNSINPFLITASGALGTGLYLRFGIKKYGLLCAAAEQLVLHRADKLFVEQAQRDGDGRDLARCALIYGPQHRCYKYFVESAAAMGVTLSQRAE